MQDAIFALGAQLAYYNWHDYNEKEKDMYIILKNKFYLDKLTAGKPADFIKENTSYIEKINGKNVTIYKEADKRLIMMYSESEDKPDLAPLFKELFTGWNFMEGTNHNKIYKETNNGKIEKKVITGSKGVYSSPNYKTEKITFNTLGIAREDSGFEAFAMKKGNDILISYRGTDFGQSKEFTKDMKNNIGLALSMDFPDQARCAIYFCEKIRKEYSGDIYIAGHSLGGALAQCVTAYMGDKVKRTVTWNPLGYVKDNTTLTIYQSVLRNKKMIHEIFLDKDTPESLMKKYNLNEIDKQFQNPYRELFKYKIYQRFIKNMPKVNNLLNYYLLEDFIKNLKYIFGKSICVNNHEKSDNLNVSDFLQSNLKFHGINNFLPFFHDNGHICPEVLRENYISNAVKSSLINNDGKLKENITVSYTQVTASIAKPVIITIKEFFAEISEGNDRGIIFSFGQQKFLLQEVLRENYNNSKKNEKYYIKDDTDKKFQYTLGKFNNCDILGGVKGKKIIKTTQTLPGVKSYGFIQLNGNQISKSEYV